MTLHPSDPSGDWLPAASPADAVSGAAAIARLAAHRLRLSPGDWWENPEEGFPLLDLLRTERIPERSDLLPALISSYLLSTEGVVSLEEVSFSATARGAGFSCRLFTADGETGLITFDI